MKGWFNLDNSLVYYKVLNPLNKIVIFGHSGAGYGTYFNRINELIKGDNLYLYHRKNVYLYEVLKSYKISENDISILKNDQNKRELYLITCLKHEKNKRLVVKLALKRAKMR